MKVKILPSLSSIKIINGYSVIDLESWSDFDHLIRSDFLKHDDYIFRGQQKSKWPLRSSFAREYNNHQNHHELLNDILRRFKHNSRGLINSELRNILNNSDNEWWALGQHFGLLTPLLDWSDSPFIAAYFAFQLEEVEKGNRAIYALSKDAIKELETEKLEIFHSVFDHNDRLINQQGLFTISKEALDIEEVIQDKFKDNNTHHALVKIVIKEENEDRFEFLNYLNRMNINHSTLFKDLNGAAFKTNYEMKRVKHNANKK
jgi:hypothetical protein